ncbi:pteridine reductase [Alkalimonas collagenimarina]|uniref:Pteridine reductase n=1 Tax=Alkalimonas collagenimarina TaxID=400390 RepID=A0ABT9GX92_9GAMM|nr:pteridine reductase [Alkalimonas collagenimarina]MDP4535300.1 pteridine reductase [Alkalimonas collagenimarina]
MTSASSPASPAPVALVTGSAKRLGCAVLKRLHQHGYRVIIHCNRSKEDAEQLANALNQQRAKSAAVISGDLTDNNTLERLAAEALQCFKRLDVLINNASSFYPTAIGTATFDDWEQLMGSNAKAPFFLSQALAPALAEQNGCIINMVDIHAERPLQEHAIYCMAKSALLMLTKSLARELAPTIRVNGIAPGAILWPSNEIAEADKAMILRQIPLERLGTPDDIADTAVFLIQSNYVNGQIIAVDGGRSLGASKKA